MEKYIGMDMDKKKTVVCVYDLESRKGRCKTLRTELAVLQDWLKKERKEGDRLHVTFEVAGHAGYYYEGLSEVADSVTVSNPSKMTWIYRTEKKNDRVDAEKQAILLAIGQIPKVHMPKREVREWRELIGHRRKMVERQTQCKNRIRALFRSLAIPKGEESGWWSAKNRKWMEKKAMAGATSWHLALHDLLEQLHLMEKQIARVTGVLDEIGFADWRVQILQTIPGVGPRTAEAVVAYTDDIDRFPNSSKFGAYFGLVPRLDESGTTRRLGHITKKGPSAVRWYLNQSCWRALRGSPALKAFFERVQHGQPDRKKIALVALMRKMVTIMYAMLKTGETFNEKLVSRQLKAAA
jgi:transposase